MGKLRSGILGHLSGKVAGVVGSRWKDQSTLREYVIPANPDTTPQQAQRSKMRIGVAFMKWLVGQIFNQYVDKFQKSMSGFNYALSQNMTLFLTPITFASVRITWGQLWGISPATTIYAGSAVTFSWDGASVGNNGSTDDAVYACVYNSATGLWYFAADEVTRDSENIAVDLPGGLNPTVLKGYILAAKYSASSPTLLEMVSNSTYSQVTA